MCQKDKPPPEVSDNGFLSMQNTCTLGRVCTKGSWERAVGQQLSKMYGQLYCDREEGDDSAVITSGRGGGLL